MRRRRTTAAAGTGRGAARDASWLASFPARNPSPVVEADLDGRVTYLNPAAERLFPDLAALGAEHPWLAGLPSFAEAFEGRREPEVRRTAVVGGRVFEQAVYFVAEGRRIRVYGWEVTERARAEEALRLSEEKYRLLFQNMGEGFALYELLRDGAGRPVDWRVLEVNDAYTLHTGLARELIVGRRMGEVFPAAVPEYLPRFARVVATQRPESFETRAASVGRDQAVTTFPAGGDRFANTVTDITARREAERALARAREELESRVEERTARLRSLAADLVTAEERERRRLAAYLHDHLQQLLVAAKFAAGGLRPLTRSGRVDAGLRRVDELLGAAIASARSLTAELSPPVLSTAGLAAAIEWLAARFRDEHGLAVQVRAGRGGEPREASARVLLFQCVRELLFNVVKHAGVREAQVRIGRASGGGVRIGVRDAGRGFDGTAEPAAGGGFGLRSIRERMESLGGTLRVRSAAGRGTTVTLALPGRPGAAGAIVTVKGRAATVRRTP